MSPRPRGPGWRWRWRGRLMLCLTLALGCAESPYRRAGNPADVAGALARAHPLPGRPANASGRPLVFLALGGARGPRLAAYDLGESRLLWTQPAEITGRVEVGADLLVHGVRGAVVGRDLATGAVRWTHHLAGAERLLGYAVDGDAAVTVLVVQMGGTHLHGGEAEVRALDTATGGLRWTHALPSANVGGPAAGGGLVAVPLQSQYVTILDARTGVRLAQVLSSEEAATFVRALPEGIFFGSRGVFRLGPDTAAGSRHASGYLQANLPSFVRPSYWYDLYRPEQFDYSAIDRNRILWRVAPQGERARFRDDLAFVHNYRFFFAFDAGSGALRWAYAHPGAEAVSSDHTGPALVFVTADGELGALDARTGRRCYRARLSGEVVRGASFDAEGFAPTATGPVPSPSLAATLSQIVWDPDRRFWDVKLFAIDELARQPGREVTAQLLAILQQQGLPPAVYQKAGQALVARQDASSADLLAEALKVHGDYVEGRGAPAIEVLARAAGAMKLTAKVAAPALMEHLLRPETEPAAAVQIARALSAMGATEALPALCDFVAMYRADPAYGGDPAALVAVSEALLKLGGAAERQLLLYIVEEPRTVEPLRAHLRRALAQTIGDGATAPLPGPTGQE